MARYFLRVEGVNLVNVIDDTDDLSTRRGGGLMLLNAIAEMSGHRNLRALPVPLKAVATGASIGLFEFEGTDEEAKAVRQAVASYCRDGVLDSFGEGEKRDVSLRHGIFVVDIIPVTGTEEQAEQMAVAANRWRQLQEPTVALAGVFDRAESYCHFDRIRPATAKVWKGNEEFAASLATKERQDYGRAARQKFYENELSRKTNLKFTDDVHQLATISVDSDHGGDAELPKDLVPSVPSHLDDKIAIFYVDGNQFGKIGREHWKLGAEAYREWSEALRSHHRDLLRSLLDRASSDPAWKNGERLRIETLLWGGDEIIWVVPAWKGWELAEWFFSHTHEVEVQGEKTSLTYAAGLVFCHANAPIRNTKGLAMRLGDLSKPKEGAPTGHRLSYEVLESFDDVEGDLDAHRQRWLPAGKEASDLILDPAQPREFWQALRRIAGSSEFPMRQLYMLCREWRKVGGTGASGEDAGPWRGEMARHRKRLQDSGVAGDLELVEKALGDSPVAYLHLLQMLPYMPPSMPPSARPE